MLITSCALISVSYTHLTVVMDRYRGSVIMHSEVVLFLYSFYNNTLATQNVEQQRQSVLLTTSCRTTGWRGVRVRLGVNSFSLSYEHVTLLVQQRSTALQFQFSLFIIIIIIVTLCGPWSSSEDFAILLYSQPHRILPVSNSKSTDVLTHPVPPSRFCLPTFLLPSGFARYTCLLYTSRCV